MPDSATTATASVINQEGLLVRNGRSSTQPLKRNKKPHGVNIVVDKHSQDHVDHTDHTDQNHFNPTGYNGIHHTDHTRMDSRSYSQRSNASNGNVNANASTRVGILVHPPRSSSLAISPSVSLFPVPQSPGLLSPVSPAPSEISSSENGRGRKLSNASSNYIATSNNNSSNNNNISSNNHHYIPLSRSLSSTSSSAPRRHPSLVAHSRSPNPHPQTLHPLSPHSPSYNYANYIYVSPSFNFHIRRPSLPSLAKAIALSHQHTNSNYQKYHHKHEVKAGFVWRINDNHNQDQLFFFAALLDTPTVSLTSTSTGPITTAPILALYNAHAAQSLLNLSDESIARASAIGPLSLPTLVQDPKTVDLANSASSLFLATEPANSLLPIAALRLYNGGHQSSVHVAEDGIFVLQVDGFDFDADADDTWMIKLDSADAMMEWLRCLRDAIKTV
ncbi:hypothetical protein HK100_001147 [Physocladia obscura]|uniref:PH domain-containing protein n=1 Tax=Physocladia obscura TaxID=109957 RepID=A0AAD5SX77_9FUNG|nr:hypothetical protein HK100_001147 [Physocladia obscura]